jgi:hypothetical protein
MLRAVSKTGSVGAQQANVLIESSDLPSQFSNSTTVSENPLFNGVKENVVLVSEQLRMDQESIMVDVIDDLFLDKWGTDYPSEVSFATGWIYFPDTLGASVIAQKSNTTAYSFYQDVVDTAGSWTLTYKVEYPIQRGQVGDYPPDGYLTVSIGDSGQVELPMSPGEHSVDLVTTTASGRITFLRNLSVVTQGEQTVPSFIEMSGFSLVKRQSVYFHSNNIDVGAVKKVRLTQVVETTRYSLNGNLWDSITGNWDTWAGYFDDWTGSARPSDTDVDVYFSKSNDNVNWADWVKFRSTNAVGRYFKFKSELKSQRQESVCPSISGLQVRAEYN